MATAPVRAPISWTLLDNVVNVKESDTLCRHY